MMKNKWKLIAHNHQIADTGDYDGYYEITDGKVSIFTKDDDDGLDDIVKTLNDSGAKFYDNHDQGYLEFLEKENKKLNFMIENGLGYKDLENDIKYPTEL